MSLNSFKHEFLNYKVMMRVPLAKGCCETLSDDTFTRSEWCLDLTSTASRHYDGRLPLLALRWHDVRSELYLLPPSSTEGPPLSRFALW